METLLPFESISRQVIVKKEFPTDKAYGCRPGDRPVEELINFGIVNVDKPSGPKLASGLSLRKTNSRDKKSRTRRNP